MKPSVRRRDRQRQERACLEVCECVSLPLSLREGNKCDLCAVLCASACGYVRVPTSQDHRQVIGREGSLYMHKRVCMPYIFTCNQICSGGEWCDARAVKARD